MSESKEVRVLGRIGGAMRKVFITALLFAALRTSPSAVSITTELPLMDIGNEVSVADPNGARVDDGTLTVTGTNVVLGMKELTVSGIYTVTYLLVAENDVPLQGQYRFTYSSPVVSAAPSTTYSPTAE